MAAAAAKKAREDAMGLRAILTALGTDSPNAETYFVDADAAHKGKDGMDVQMTSIMGAALEDAYDGTNSDVPTLTNGMTTITGSTPAHTMPVDGTAFSSGSLKTHKRNEVNDDGDGAVFRTTGTCHGVSGTYTCSGAGDCTSSVSSAGALVLAGVRTFKPFDVKAKAKDSTGLEFGWWMSDATDDEEAMVRVFYGAESATVLPAATYTLGGKATYRGSAAGKYAIHRGAGSENESGSFTAKAMLEANFTDPAGDGVPEIGGMITDFMGDDKMPRNWSV